MECKRRKKHLAKSKNNVEQRTIFNWIHSGASVLDLGCGDGDLLIQLVKEKRVRAQGVEVNEQSIHRCVSAGLSVFQQDIDTGLSEYGDKSFDFVILNQTLQQVEKPDLALTEALRVGKQVVVGFPNFCYITDRLQIFFRGRVPVTTSLPYQWYDTPNLHFLSVADFIDYCRKRKLQMIKSAYFSLNRKVRFLPNLFAEIGLFLLVKPDI
jgi:methionine biosynthesis protein MetW